MLKNSHGILGLTACFFVILFSVGENLFTLKKTSYLNVSIPFRFESLDLDNSKSEVSCIGTWVSPKKFITAAHCVHFKPSKIMIYQKNRLDVVSNKYLIDSIRLHPSYDIALVELDSKGLKIEGKMAIIAPKIDWSKKLYATVPASKKENEQFISMSIESFSWPVVLVQSDSGCLKRGDSGTPFRIDSLASAPVVAILIRGSIDCKGIQTLLPLDLVYELIYEEK